MIKKETNPVSYRACIKTLCGLVTTIVNNADKESTRRINVANKTWQVSLITDLHARRPASHSHASLVPI